MLVRERNVALQPCIRLHDVTLNSGPVTLRPLTDADMSLQLLWWNDPEISYYGNAEDNPQVYSSGDLQNICASISQVAYCFIIEYNGVPVGDCWLQMMNVDRIIEANLGKDCRRIDLGIEKTYWGRGIGTASITLLCELGFVSERVDAIFAFASC